MGMVGLVFISFCLCSKLCFVRSEDAFVENMKRSHERNELLLATKHFVMMNVNCEALVQTLHTLLRY